MNTNTGNKSNTPEKNSQQQPVSSPAIKKQQSAEDTPLNVAIQKDYQPGFIAKQQRQPNQQQMSTRPQQQADAIPKTSAWSKQVSNAKTMWGKLTDAELLHSNGKAENLSSLIQERYHINSSEADKQVKTFLDKCNC
ncbi:hypothetical protein [Cellvibrio sp. UBA7661]|uniref:CsbD family protein n=1 Tax=Cellvibrio sp. UBA7661 TaxID=1946311 RepID=UPI002F35CDB7